MLYAYAYSHTVNNASKRNPFASSSHHLAYSCPCRHNLGFPVTLESLNERIDKNTGATMSLGVK